MSKVLTRDEFNKEVLGSKEPVIVDFYADWCGPCRMLAPTMDEIGKDHKVFKVNKGDAFGQGIFMKYLTVDDEEEITNDRKGGLGSTNK